MCTSSKRLLFAVALLASILAAAARAAGDAAAPPRNLARIADQVARESLTVKEGDLVEVRGFAHSQPFLDELAVAIARQGGSPSVMSLGEKTALRFYTDVPDKHDAAQLAFSKRTAEFVTAVVELENAEHPGQYRSVPAARVATVMREATAVAALHRQHKARVVAIGNGLYPNDATAKRLGISKRELEKLFWDALAVAPSKLAEAAAPVRRALAAGREVRVTTAEGTDLRFFIEARPVFLSDGVVKPEDVERGSNTTWLPAGEVFLAPVRGTAEGKVVVARQAYSDGFIEGLTVVFEKGRVVSHVAKPSPAYARFQELYAAAPERKDELGVLDIGVNPGARRAKGTLRSFIPAGNVTLGIGQNAWAGGDADVPFGHYFMLTGATVTLDGKPVVDRGELVAGGGAM